MTASARFRVPIVRTTLDAALRLVGQGLVLAALAGVLPAGCRTGPPEHTPRIDAFGADGRGPARADLEALASGSPDGIVVRYRAGDRIVVAVRVAGDVVRSEPPGEVVLTFMQPVEVWLSASGVRVRTKQGTWRSIFDAFDGQLSISTGFADGDSTNRASIELLAESAP